MGDTVVVAASGIGSACGFVMAGVPEVDRRVPVDFARLGVATAQPFLAMQSLNTVTSSALRAALVVAPLVAATVASAIALQPLLISK